MNLAMQEKSILNIVKTTIATAILFSFIVFAIYAWQFGPISSLRDDWSAFGSLLAGIFTLLSAVATVSTLILFSIQLKKQQETVVFEQYITHRKLFFERLDELEKLLDIKFYDRDQFYQCIFPRNRPGVCFTHEEVKTAATLPGDISDCCFLYHRIGKQLKEKMSWHEAAELVTNLVRMQGKLFFSFSASKFLDGEVVFLNQPTKMSIFSIGNALQDIEKVLNSILFFSGNEKIAPISHLAAHDIWDQIRVATKIQHYTNIIELRLSYFAKKWISLYDELDAFEIDEYTVLPKSHTAVRYVLESFAPKNLQKIDFAELLDSIEKECNYKKDFYSQTEETVNKIDAIYLNAKDAIFSFEDYKLSTAMT
ncbi:hypothetical protein [Chromobacterium violaceum]|uniref:hypothetical protein n=1 Tax=Chromobacterium violaceum TaxID=536 RepID=UPI0012D3430F|nr:hypothetical protein [Chromobacterium violaceum]